MIYPVLTLWQPWATWIMRRWKLIETRTHDRFRSLNGKTILIHAGKVTDRWGVNAYFYGYLTKEQLMQDPDEIINGFILGSAFVCDFQKLTPDDAKSALIECWTDRYGLFLRDIAKFGEPIKEVGSMGIWYYDLENKCKVSVEMYNRQERAKTAQRLFPGM